jgi:hypothetical protein
LAHCLFVIGTSRGQAWSPPRMMARAQIAWPASTVFAVASGAVE